MARLTGERPMVGATPDSLLAFHDAGYREVRERIAPAGGGGRSVTVLDVGCGVGEQTAKLAGIGRVVIGVDYSTATAIDALREYGPRGLRFAAMDGARIGVKDRSVDYVCSSHIIEHFVAPEQHVAELARVTAAGGTAFVITPNRPADFENPFHVSLFEAPELESLLKLFFADVEILGLEGDDALHADFGKRRASGEKLLKLDPLSLRTRVPRSWYVWSYEHVLPVVYRALGSDNTGIGSGLDESHFFATAEITPRTPGLFAIARNPRS
jgi:ubiquinone/menaquinone biosynthesis C-methylase UbiE